MSLTHRPRPAGSALPTRLVALSWLVLAQAVAMLVYALATVVVAASSEEPNWGAVAYVVVTLCLWGAGLVWVALRGLRRARRWSFSPVMFTQLMFGIIAITDLGARGNPAVVVVVWALVLASACAALYLLFSRDVRDTLVPPPAG